MHDVERSNRAQIEALNQRGGRTLSITDLIRAGTISSEAAAYVGHRVRRGASLLTAANPGGAGKTALLAALLGLLPAGLSIVTVESPRVVAAAEQATAPACYLAHEIGSGHWYGYLWGESVARYLALAERHTVASCLHADTVKELRAALTAPPLRVTAETLAGIDFLLFMHVDRAARGYRRRVAAIYESMNGEHQLVSRWDRERDAHELLVPVGEEATALARVLLEVAEAGVVEYGEVRERVQHSM